MQPTTNLLIPGLVGPASNSTVMDELHSLNLNNTNDINQNINLDSLLSIADSNSNPNSLTHQQQPQQHHHHQNRPHNPNYNNHYYHHHQNHSHVTAPGPIHYRKVRPEPINERTLVGSVVGFLQDVVTGGDSSHPVGGSGVKRANQVVGSVNNHHTSSSSGMPNEIKEQIEWLHVENVNLLDSFEHTQFANSNIILVLGYKTGFSVWSIDVS